MSNHNNSYDVGDPDVLDHERGRVGESSILIDQGYHAWTNFTRNSVLSAGGGCGIPAPPDSERFSKRSSPSGWVRCWGRTARNARGSTAVV